jgi:low temperature requirement protein LtrA
MTTPSIVSPEDQSATFVELFFDLVFVFSMTQVVRLLHHDFDWVGVGQAVLVFWLVWWAWTQFTWTLNATDTTHRGVGLATLVATGLVFFMAIALPDAFHGEALWFAVPYILVRLIGLGLQLRAAREGSFEHTAARTWALASLGGLVAVLVGAVIGGSLLYWFWGLTILLDLFASAVGGRREGWNLHPEHFAERHGLFVILALGETLIAAGTVVSESAWSGDLTAVSMLAVAFTCTLWWTYFPQGHPSLEDAMRAAQGAERATLARDAFSLLHFPMICGVIAYAVAVEEAVAHPSEPLSLAARLALAVGLLFFIGGMAAATWRATRQFLWPRFGLTLVAAGAIAVVVAPPVLSLGIAFASALIVAVLERESDPSTAGASA